MSIKNILRTFWYSLKRIRQFNRSNISNTMSLSRSTRVLFGRLLLLLSNKKKKMMKSQSNSFPSQQKLPSKYKFNPNKSRNLAKEDYNANSRKLLAIWMKTPLSNTRIYIMTSLLHSFQMRRRKGRNQKGHLDSRINLPSIKDRNKLGWLLKHIKKHILMSKNGGNGIMYLHIDKFMNFYQSCCFIACYFCIVGYIDATREPWFFANYFFSIPGIEPQISASEM